MIQRIQTIYFLLAIILLALFFIPAVSFVTTEGDTSSSQSMLLADGIYNISDHLVLLILVLLGGLLPLVALFQFKNRPLQVRLGKVAIFLLAGLLAFAAIFLFVDMQAAGQMEVSFGFGFIVPVLCIIFLYLANRAAQKDEKLVRSADRLR